MKIERVFGAAALSILLPTHLAAAADLPIKMPVKAPPAKTAAAFDWTGFYLGGHLGYATGTTKWSATQDGAAAPPLSGSLDLFNPYDPFKGTGSFFVGPQAGYAYVLPSRLVIGIETDMNAPNTIAGNQVLTSPMVGQANFSDRMLLSGTARGRLGYAFDGWLGYATGGFAWSYDQLTRTQFVATGAAGSATAGAVDAPFLWRLGWTAGAGVELPIGSNWSAKFEYLFTDFERASATFPAGGQRFDSELFMQSLKVGFNYHLGEDLTKSDIFTKGTAPLELDNFSIHGQTTLVGQYALPFHAPYAGTNSLAANSGRETWDSNLYIGLRPWDGGELWIDPELDQGFGLSGTFGVAGFPSAEAYKVGSSYPYARLPRLFFRQTIDLGGDSLKVEPDFNQFAGTVTSDRLVFTVGKFSVVDLFDANKYAHDPRGDFLNWTLVDTGAFDYAADAWAFTYGAAAEWYKGPWALRAGLFDAPAVPNSTDLDPTFRQFQMVGEIERRYELWEQPGKIAVTGFLTRARMGDFDAAVALAEQTGGRADITAVRSYTSKPGIAGNLEQQIVPNIGVFARAGWNPGKLEPDAFTDADRTLSGGASLSGKLWGRPDDKLGVGGIFNFITSEHAAYFNAGGLTALLGDGALPHPGPEQILETYYQFPVFTWRVTVDYQFIVNPAYNRDRGPVSVIATRWHTDF